MDDPASYQVGAGAGALLTVLALLAVTVGLGPPGWIAGAVYGLVGVSVLVWAMHRSGPRALGPADLVTLARTVLVGGVVALVADGGAPWALVALAASALCLDLVDGVVARSTGTESGFGARFDMETDAFLILVLSVWVALSLGPWVLVIGLMRYAFAAAIRVAPWLGAPLPPSRARRAVAAVQGVVLVVAAPEVLPSWGSTVLVALALAALTWSFGRDVRGLWRGRERRGRGQHRSGTSR